jgi:hypothetical protein
MCVALVLIAMAGLNCDIGINPLLFDGPPVTGTFRVDAAVPAYATIQAVDLRDVFAGLDKEVDSIKVYNVTLQIDSTAGTNPSTTITGSVLIDGDSLLSVSGASIAEFATERSIFDATLTGGPIYVQSGVDHLIELLKEYKSSPGDLLVTVVASGTASTSNLHFTMKLRVYTQLFLPPPGS